MTSRLLRSAARAVLAASLTYVVLLAFDSGIWFGLAFIAGWTILLAVERVATAGLTRRQRVLSDVILGIVAVGGICFGSVYLMPAIALFTLADLAAPPADR